MLRLFVVAFLHVLVVRGEYLELLRQNKISHTIPVIFCLTDCKTFDFKFSKLYIIF